MAEDPLTYTRCQEKTQVKRVHAHPMAAGGFAVLAVSASFATGSASRTTAATVWGV